MDPFALGNSLCKLFFFFFSFRWRATVLLFAWGRFLPPPRGKIFNLGEGRNWSISAPSPFLNGHQSCYFCKASNLSGLRLEAFGTLLSQTLITYSHNSQPVDSHQQTVPGVPYSPFSPSLLHLPLYSSTASGLIQIDRLGTRGRNLSEEELLVYERGGGGEDANIFSQNHYKTRSPRKFYHV